MENSEENEMKLFACPSCGTDVNEDAKNCPGCNAQFEEEESAQHVMQEMKNIKKEPQQEKNVEYPPPPGWIEKKSDDSDPPKENEEKVQKPSPSEVESHHDISAEPELDNQEIDSEEKIKEDDDFKTSGSLQDLKRLDEEINLHKEELGKESQSENQILTALKQYNNNRRKRYFTGTLFVGLGVILFVLLWLVVVYDVLVYETDTWFGAHVILILVAAGIFFTFGLYMILTYPKSSLIDILTYMNEVKQKRRSTEY